MIESRYSLFEAELIPIPAMQIVSSISASNLYLHDLGGVFVFVEASEQIEVGLR
jgi:hypothetical protein